MSKQLPKNITSNDCFIGDPNVRVTINADDYDFIETKQKRMAVELNFQEGFNAQYASASQRIQKKR